MSSALLWRQIGLALTSVFVVSCAHFGADRGTPEEQSAAEALLDQAARATQAEHFAEGRDALERFLADYPRHPENRSAKLQLAELYYRLQEYENIISLLRRSRWEDPDRSDQSARLKGLALFRLDRPDEALQAWLPLLERKGAGDKGAPLSRATLAAAQLAEDARLALIALDWLAFYSRDADEKQEALDVSRALIGSLADAEQRAELSQALQAGGEVWRLLSLFEVKRAIAEDRRSDALALRDQLVASPHQDHPDVVLALEELEAWSAFYGMALGVLVPVTGRAKAIGASLVHGLQLGSHGIDLVIQDAAGADESKLKATLRELASDSRILAVVGPADRAKSEALSRSAKRLGLPFISFAPYDAPYATTFRILHTVREQIAKLVEHASRAGATRMGIFYPKHGYGITVRNFFVEALKQRDLEPCALQTYSPKSTEWAKNIEAIQAGACQSIMLADRPKMSASLAAALISHGVGEGFKHPLLLPGPTYSAQTLRLAGRSLNGALVALHARLGSGEPAVEQFSRRYRETHRSGADFLAANAYDVGRIISDLAKHGITSRERVLEGLQGTLNLQGVGCAQGFSRNSAPAQEACVAQIHNGRIQLLE